MADPATLLRAEHAVARVLAGQLEEAEAYPRLLTAIGEALGWVDGAAWALQGGELRHVAGAAVDDALARRVCDSGEPAWEGDTVCFPLAGAGAFRFRAGPPDDAVLAATASLGARIGHWLEARRAEQARHESDARRHAMFDAATDAIITMDAAGIVTEVNPVAERMFGYTAAEMVGRELAELVIPPALREAHRHGVERYVATGESTMVGHPVDLPAMRADGSEFPVEIAITRPLLPGPPQFTGYVRDVTARKHDEEALRSLAAEQAALRRVATEVAREADQERVFAAVTEEVGRLLGAAAANLVRFEAGGTGVVAGAWSRADVAAVPEGTRVELDGPSLVARILRSGRPERMDSYQGVPGAAAEMARGFGFRSGLGAPIELGGQLWGAVTVSTVEASPFPPGCEQRIANFAELVSVALANAAAREELAASRARIVEAGDAERRRLERNLHDGAQQRLVALALTLRLAERKLTAGDEQGLEMLQRASAELTEALEELRELARGIHPAVLTERGLVPALEMLAGRASLPVELSAALANRLPQPVEAATYYVVAEALTNASKHARASTARVTVSHANGHAVVEVADDGVGGADAREGSGLRGLSDRIEALGGTLRVESPPGAGTTLRAFIPCASAAASSRSLRG
jgi:PAS domain S-box-containing protein